MKLRRKLLAAGFAFGATALTLTTSTFAWYTANNTVSGGTVSGMTSTTANSDSLYIASAKNYASNSLGAAAGDFTTFGTVATPITIASAAGVTSASHYLEPVAYDKTTSTATSMTYNTMSAAGSDVTYTALTNTNAVYEYVLRFQVPNIQADTPIYVSGMTLTNSAAKDDFKQLALADNTTLGSGNVGVKEAGYYSVDMLHALKMTVTATPLSFDSTKTEASERWSLITASATTTIYDLDAFADTSKDTNVSEANAVAYYNQVLGTSISTPSDYLKIGTNAPTKIKAAASGASTHAADSNLFSVSKDYGYVEVRFTFWLDGWDEYCYDVCRKQAFACTMSFSSKNTDAILEKVTE